MSGFLLIVLGVWGALIPFVGPYFDFAFTPDQAWAWTDARGWLEVSARVPPRQLVVFCCWCRGNRATAMLGGWLSVIGGAWFIVGRASAGLLGIGDAGSPVAVTETKSVVLELAYFYGLGALIVFLGAIALGRISVRSVRDVEFVDRPMAAPAVVPQEPAYVGRGDGDPADTSPRRRLTGMFGRRHTHAH